MPFSYLVTRFSFEGSVAFVGAIIYTIFISGMTEQFYFISCVPNVSIILASQFVCRSLFPMESCHTLVRGKATLGCFSHQYFVNQGFALFTFDILKAVNRWTLPNSELYSHYII